MKLAFYISIIMSTWNSIYSQKSNVITIRKTQLKESSENYAYGEINNKLDTSILSDYNLNRNLYGFGDDNVLFYTNKLFVFQKPMTMKMKKMAIGEPNKFWKKA